MTQKMEHRYFSLVDLMALEQRYRAAFVNSLSGFKSVCLIGTKDNEQKTNLAIFNSLVHIGANPPFIGFISRPDSVDRHTLANIKSTGYYTINHIQEEFYKKAHQTAARYDKNISEFDATGLTEDYKNFFPVPYVKESIIQMGVELKEIIPISVNQTILVVGQIRHVYFPNTCLCEDGFLDIEKAGTITCSGLDSYHKTQRISRLNYAKPGKQIGEAKIDYINR